MGYVNISIPDDDVEITAEIIEQALDDAMEANKIGGYGMDAG